MPLYTTVMTNPEQTTILREIIADYAEGFCDLPPKPEGDYPDWSEWIRSSLDAIAAKANKDA